MEEDQTSRAGAIRGEAGKGYNIACFVFDVLRCVTAGDCCCDYEPQCVTNTSTPSSESPTSPLEDNTDDTFSLGNVTIPEIHTESCSSSGSCTGRCGGGSHADCWCDQDCVHNGDCCCDRELLCHSSVSKRISCITNPESLQSYKFSGCSCDFWMSADRHV